MGQEAPAGVAQLHPASAAVNQRLANGVLQPLDALGQRLLGEEQPGGGAAEVVLLGDLHEGPHLRQVQLHARNLGRQPPVVKTARQSCWTPRVGWRCPCGMKPIDATGSPAAAPLSGVAAGVPYLALPPAGDTRRAPLVVAWGGLGSPGSEQAMAAALPLARLPAWRAYLPLLAAGAPTGGPEELLRPGAEAQLLGADARLEQEVAGFPCQPLPRPRSGGPAGCARAGTHAGRGAGSTPGSADARRGTGRRRGHRLAGSVPDQQGGVMTKPHKQGRLVEVLPSDLALRHAKPHVAWLLEEPRADRRSRIGRHRRRPTRTTRTTRRARGQQRHR